MGLTDWHLGTNYIPPSIIPLAWIGENQEMNVVFPDNFNNVTRGKFAVVWNQQPGIIVYQVNDPRLDLIVVGIGATIVGLSAWLAYLIVEASSRATLTGGFA